MQPGFWSTYVELIEQSRKNVAKLTFDIVRLTGQLSGSSGRTYRNLSELVDDFIS